MFALLSILRLGGIKIAVGNWQITKCPSISTTKRLSKKQLRRQNVYSLIIRFKKLQQRIKDPETS